MPRASKTSGVVAQKMPRVGLDFGGVLQHVAGTDSNFDVENMPLMDGVLEGCKRLVDLFGAENVFIVSKAGSSVAKGSLRCLEKNCFFAETGFLRENIHFTTKRNGSEGKWPVIKKLGLDAMVDDNWSLFCDPLVDELLGAQAAGTEGSESTKPDILCVFFAPSDPDLEKTVQLDRTSDDKKANRGPKAPYACGKELYYREYCYEEFVDSRNIHRIDDQNWQELVDALEKQLLQRS